MKHSTFIGQGSFAVGLPGLIQRLAPLRGTVVITGESGSGKSIIAHDLHKHGGRPGQLAILDCTTTPEGLFESELFGSRKGAFTGAADTPGIIKQASEGTLWLEEIGELSPSCQGKLLRLLDGKFRPIGGRQDINLDARIIATTNQDLKELVAQNKFRADLFYRLQRLQIRIPPLRQRPEDILPIFQHCIKTCEMEQSRNAVLEVNEISLALLKRYPWPGNVREIESVVLNTFVENPNALTISTNDFARTLSQLNKDDKQEQQISDSDRPSLVDTEKQAIKKALVVNHWNLTATCKQLGITDRTIRAKIKKYNFKKPEVISIEEAG